MRWKTVKAGDDEDSTAYWDRASRCCDYATIVISTLAIELDIFLDLYNIIADRDFRCHDIHGR